MHSILITASVQNLNELDSKLRAAIPEFTGLTYSENEGLKAWFTSNDINYNLLDQTIISQSTSEYYRQVIANSIAFANKITTDFAAENVTMGITQSGKTKLIADACKDATYYLQTGSLYEAEAEMARIEITQEMAPFITQERVTAFRNKIRSYLGMPLL